MPHAPRGHLNLQGGCCPKSKLRKEQIRIGWKYHVHPRGMQGMKENPLSRRANDDLATRSHPKHKGFPRGTRYS